MPFTLNETISKQFVITITNFTDAELNEFITSYKSLFNKYESRVKIIFNAENLSELSFNQIKVLSLLLISMKPIHKEKLEKFAIIVRNKLIIRILSGIFDIIPPVRPFIVADNIQKALEYMKEEKKGISKIT